MSASLPLVPWPLPRTPRGRLFNHETGVLRYARAGHPFPLLIPLQGEPALLEQEGLLLGIFDARFPCGTVELAPGDKLLLYTDGIDTAVFEDSPPGKASLIACARRHRDLGVQDLIARVAHDLFGTNSQPDDLTLLGLERSA